MTWFTVEGGYAATQTQLPPQALAGVQHARDHNAVVVRHDYATWDQLRSRGLVLPNPMAHYAYPGRWQPRDNQRRTAEWFIEHTRGICLNGMRTGKTMSALWAMDYLRAQGQVRRVLVVAPVSTHDTVWERNIFLHLPHVRAAVAKSGAAASRRQEIARDRGIHVVIINPDALHIVAEHITDLDLIICDEATAFKNPRSRRWKVLTGILAKHNPRLWLLTASPTPQSPEDAYGLVRLLHPHKYVSATQWKDLTMKQVSKFRWIPKPDAAATVSAWLRPSIRFTLADCGDVPEVQYEELVVDLSPEQQALTAQLKDDALAEVDGGQITVAHAASLLSKLLQVQCGGVYAMDHANERLVHRVPAPAYFDAVAEYIEEADTPVLVFAPFRSAVEALFAEMQARGLRVAKIDGDTKPADRLAAFDAMQRGELQATIAVPACMSHGITLDRANYVLWAAPPFKGEEYEQANGRVLQAASSKRIVVTHVVTSAVARELFSRLQSKARLQDTVLNLLGAGA